MSEAAVALHLRLAEATLANHRVLTGAQMRALARALLHEARLVEDLHYDGGPTGTYLVAFSQVTAQLTVLREKVREIELLRLAVEVQVNGNGVGALEKVKG